MYVCTNVCRCPSGLVLYHFQQYSHREREGGEGETWRNERAERVRVRVREKRERNTEERDMENGE
jgi:hypothetical protein